MKKFLLCTIALLVLAGAAFWALLSTTAGSKLIIHQAISRVAPHQPGSQEIVMGNIMAGITLENFELNSIKGLPEGSSLRIQKLYINGNKFFSEGLVVDIDNARLRIKSSDPLVLNGTLRNQELNFNLYGPGVGINEIKGFAELDWLKPYSGTILNLDFNISGTIERPRVTGSVLVEELHREAISLFQMPLTCDLEIHDIGGDIQLFGSVATREGWLQSRRTKVLLKESKVTFNGDPLKMQLNLRGESKIENVQIAIRITGTKDNPEINLSSEPSLPKDALMIMLATGKRWESLENSLAGQTLSPEIASDFIDFFFFNGQGNKFAQRFGLKDIHVTYTQEKQGVGVTKAVTSKVDVGYGVEKMNATQQNTSVTTQTIEGQYKLTDNVSLELERKLESQGQTNSLENDLDKVQSEDTIMLKFRTKF